MSIIETKDTQATLERLARLPCRACKFEDCEVCLDADNRPTGHALPGLTERCSCISKIQNDAHYQKSRAFFVMDGGCHACWDNGHHEEDCLNCTDGRTLLTGPALLVAVLREVGKYVQYIYTKWTPMGFWEAGVVVGVESPHGYQVFQATGDMEEAMLAAAVQALATCVGEQGE